MPKTNEIAFNVRLLDVLQTKHLRWRDHVGVEQRDVLRETALQPDIVIRPPVWVTDPEDLKKIKKHILKKRNLSNDHAGVRASA